jgi:glycosyltransferase involved in cell wall biosynthesis
MTSPPASAILRERPPDAAAPARVRVLHLNAGNMYGGVETLLTTFATSRELCPGMEPHFAFCYEGRSSREIQAAGAPLYLLGPARISRPWTVWQARRRLKDLLRKERFDLVVCHMEWTLAIFGGVVRAAGHKVTLWMHGFQAGGHWLERLAQRNHPELVIANSRFTASEVQLRYPHAPVSVIYCAVAPPLDLDHLRQGRTSTREDLGVDESTIVILQAGRLEAWKGHTTTLHALSQLTTGRKWMCWIAGGPQTQEQEKYLAQLEETANRLGIVSRVRFLGQRSDVPRLMAAADIFCQPNEGPEPFGLVFIEALGSGLPVVSSAIGGAVEIVDESCGLLVEAGDAAGLAHSLDTLIESAGLRARLAQAGPGRARVLCDPASQIEKLRELIVKTRATA